MREESHGYGKLSDWVLLVTDYSNTLRVYYMDIISEVAELPKYGDLYVEEPSRRDGWSTFFGTKGEQISEGLSTLSRGACYGVDTTGMNGVRSGDTYRYCYQNFGVGPELPPLGGQALASYNHIKGERVVYYMPRINFLGKDTFSFHTLNGVDKSLMKGTVKVNVRNCRLAFSATKRRVQSRQHMLCSCSRTDRQYSGDPITCPLSLASVCSDLMESEIFYSLCGLCGRNSSSLASFSAECKEEINRATVLLQERRMCGGLEPLADCQTELTSEPARESFVFSGSPNTMDRITPLSNANDGQGFMWSAWLA